MTQEKEIRRVDLGCCEMVTTYTGHHIEHKDELIKKDVKFTSHKYEIDYQKHAGWGFEK